MGGVGASPFLPIAIRPLFPHRERSGFRPLALWGLYMDPNDAREATRNRAC